MKLIVGLGNPGTEYAATRHNVGWQVLDALATKLGAAQWSHSDKSEAEMIEVGEGAAKTILLKPTTFMNNSGRAVERVRAYYKLEPSDLVIIHDELAVPFGTIRIRQGGQTAGHNGVGSVMHHLGSDQFWRVRIGIESDHPERSANPTGFVLSRFTPSEQSQLSQIVDQTADHLVQCLTSGRLEETTFTIEQ